MIDSGIDAQHLAFNDGGTCRVTASYDFTKLRDLLDASYAGREKDNPRLVAACEAAGITRRDGVRLLKTVHAATEETNRLGIATGADLRERDPAFLTGHFGKAGAWYHKIAHGEDDREVTPDRPRKSSGSETTFEHDLKTPDEVLAAVRRMADQVWDWCERTRTSGKTVVVKARYADFRIVTRSKTLGAAAASHADLIAVAERLVASLFPLRAGIRLIVVTLASMAPLDEADQLALPVD